MNETTNTERQKEKKGMGRREGGRLEDKDRREGGESSPVLGIVGRVSGVLETDQEISGVASEPVVTQQARGAAVAGGGGKQKIPLGKGNNRKTFGDIGNLVPVPSHRREAQRRILPSLNMARTRSPVYLREKSMASPGTQSAMTSPKHHHHSRSGSTGVSFRRPQNFAAKAAAQRLAQVMAHQSTDDDDEDDDDDGLSLDYNPTGSIGLASGRAMRSPSPANPAARATSQRQTNFRAHQQTGEDDDDLSSDYKATGSIGLASGRKMRSGSPAVISGQTNFRAHQHTGEDDDDLYSDYKATGSIGHASGRSMRSQSPALGRNFVEQTPSARSSSSVRSSIAEQTPSSRSSTANRSSIAVNSVEQTPSSRSSTANWSSIAVNSVEQTPSSRSSTASRSSLATNSVEQPPPAHTSLPGRSSPSVNSTEQSPSPRFTSAGRSSVAVNSMEQPVSARATSAARSIFAANSVEQPPSARSASAGRPFQAAKTVAMVPPTVPISLKPPTSVHPSDPSTDHRRDRRSSVDLGSLNMRETGNQRSTHALEDELDMLQEENGSLLEKLRLVEERCKEAEARARQLEEQVASLGEGVVSLETRLSSRKEAGLQKREAALKAAPQTHDGLNVEIAALRLEAETAKDEAESSLEQLREAECEIKSLRTMTQRMILSQEEMEEVVLKRCWLTRHWNLCVQHGIHPEIAAAKYEFWSSLAPLPLEVVLSAGQKAKEESSVEKTYIEERDKVPRDLNEVSGDGNIESMLLVEKGMREVASLKVEDAVMLAMAQHRQQCLLKSDQRVSGADNLKLTVDDQNLLEACELSQEECQHVAFKQSLLIYYWRRAKNHGLEQDVADERLQYWITSISRSPTPHDAVEVERGLMELRKLGIETQLWEESRRAMDPDSSYPRIPLESEL